MSPNWQKAEAIPSAFCCIKALFSMTILITGAQGFVGSHLIKALSKNKIYTLTQKKTSNPNSVFCDLTHAKQVQEAVKKIKPDLVYHLAAQSSVPYSWEHPAETFQVNVLGTLHLIEALKANKKKCTFLAIESGEVYGKGESLTEESPFSPQNPYAASKAAAEMALYSYFKDPFLKIVRARPFNHIGPGQDTRFAVAHFAYQIAAIEAQKIPPEIHVGNLKPKRDFTDVRDVVWAYQLLAKKGKAGEAYNICSEKLVSIEWILKKLLSFCSEKIDIKIDPQFCRKNDILWIAASAKKLRQTTGWSPQIPLEQSLKDTLNFFRKELKKK